MNLNIFSDLRKPGLVPGESLSLSTNINSVLEKNQIYIMSNRMRSLRMHDHVSSSMKNLHWLKIPERITYKLCLLMYKCQNNLAPRYLSNFLQSRPSSRLLQSSQSDNIYVTYFKNSQCQLSPFSSAGPRAWNSLPTAIKTAQSLDTFKTLLKTHLFNISYNK